jgi:hypothetical protein
MYKHTFQISCGLLLLIALSGCGGGGTPGQQVGGNSAPGTGPVTGTHSIMVSWTAPSQRTDASALTTADIAGYVIRYSQTSGNLDQSITVNDGAATSHAINNLADGTWYFSIQTRDIQGQTSSLTPEQSVTL